MRLFARSFGRSTIFSEIEAGEIQDIDAEQYSCGIRSFLTFSFGTCWLFSVIERAVGEAGYGCE
jgi:hypothetical protein